MAQSGRLQGAHVRPDVAGAEWLFRMWAELGSCRHFGEVPGPIPITAAWAYVDRYDLPEWAVDAMFSLDAAWREAEARKLPPTPPAAQRPPVRMRRHGR